MDPSSEARAEKNKSLQLYAQQVGAAPLKLQDFADSLWRSSEYKSTANCLSYFADDVASRNEFLECLSHQGQSFYTKKFIEDLVPMRLHRLKNIHDPVKGPEYRKSLRLLNWLYDLALEQYSFRDPQSFWLEPNADGGWSFRTKDPARPDWTLKNRADFDFQDGDVSLNIAAEYFSTIIPQFTYPERRLTHMWVYSGDKPGQDGHMMEALLGEGVWPTYKDSFRERGDYYEQYVLRYNNREKSKAENETVRRRAAEVSDAKMGSEYNFSGDNRKGFFCTFLGSLSFASVFFDLDGLEGVPLFDKVSSLFPMGYTPLRKGLSRDYAAKFGVDPNQESFPSAGDFFTVENFDTIGFYMSPKLSKEFSDSYAFSESLIDAVDRGATINLPEKIKEIMDPLVEDREMLKGLIGYVRRIHSKSIFRNKLIEQKVSLKFLEDKTPSEFYAILDRLDAERAILQDAAVRNLTSLKIWNRVFKAVPDVNDPTRMMSPTEFFDKMRKNDGKGQTAKDFEQLHKFIDAVNLEDVHKLLEGVLPQMPIMGSLIPLVRWNRDQGKFSPAEVAEYTELLRNYAMLILSVPTLKEKVAELNEKIARGEMDKDALTNLFKLTPYLASDLSVETISEFVVLQKLGGGVVDGFRILREKFGLDHLWQTPPWVQRQSFEYIIREKAKDVVTYK